MSYIVQIELDDWEQLHSIVDRLTGEITEFEQEFIDLTRAKLIQKYESNYDLPNVPRKSLHTVFDETVYDYEQYLYDKKSNL